MLILGDLNDHPDDPSVRQHLKTSGDAAQAVGGTFFNATAAIQQDPSRGTYVFQNKREVIDHVIASPGLLDAQGFRLKAGSAREVKFPEQIFTPNSSDQIPRPNRTFTGDNYHPAGISDHLAVNCVLEF